MPEVMRDGVRAQNSNPEVEVDMRKPNSVINQQILQLKLITNKLASAYRGIDVDWIDTGACAHARLVRPALAGVARVHGWEDVP